jgi:hypothetical protein
MAEEVPSPLQIEIRGIYDEARKATARPPRSMLKSMLFNVLVDHTVSMIHQEVPRIPFHHGLFYAEVTRINDMFDLGIEKTTLTHK